MARIRPGQRLMTAFMTAAMVFSLVPTGAFVKADDVPPTSASILDGNITIPAGSEVEWDSRAIVQGNVLITLEEGSKLSAPYGITVPSDASLAIKGKGYADIGSALNKEMYGAYDGYAGIGGDPDHPDAGVIEIKGGAHVEAYAGARAAAIGGGKNGEGGVILFSEPDTEVVVTPHVCLTPEETAPAIGSGTFDQPTSAGKDRYYISIQANVKVNTGASEEFTGTSIGGGYNCSGGSVDIGGGTVDAGQSCIGNYPGEPGEGEITFARWVHWDPEDTVQAGSISGKIVLEKPYAIASQGTSISVDSQILDAGEYVYTEPQFNNFIMGTPMYRVTFMDEVTGNVGHQDVLEAKLAQKPIDPICEGKTFLGWYTDQATPFDFETPITSSITLTAKWGASDFTVAAYSSNDECSASVTNVSISPLKDSYTPGEKVTFSTAPHLNGFDFLGWFTVQEVEGSHVKSYGDLVSSQATFTCEVEDNLSYVAVYQPVKDQIAFFNVISENGRNHLYTVEVNGVSTDYTRDYGGFIPVGSKITVTSKEGDRFVNWSRDCASIRQPGKIATTEKSYSFILLGNTVLVHNLAAQATTSSMVQFISGSNQIVYSNTFSATSTITFPEAPSKSGYRFDKWVIESTGDEATEASIKALIPTQRYIAVKATYIPLEDTIDVVRRIVIDGTMHNTVTNTCRSGRELSFVAGGPLSGHPNARFLYWRDGKTGEILSYNSTFVFAPFEYREVEAFYTEDVAKKVVPAPTIRLDGMYPVDENGVHKVKGVLTRSIPEGYSLVQQDFLYNIGSWGLDDSNCYRDDQSTLVKVYITPFAQRDATLALNVKVTDDTTPVTIRGYMILRNEDTNTLEYIYTHTMTKTYAELVP